MSRSEFTANDARRKALRTTLGLVLGAALAAGAVLWAHSIVAEIADWQAERNAAVEARR